MPEQFVSGINVFFSGNLKNFTPHLQPKKCIFLFGIILDIIIIKNNE